MQPRMALIVDLHCSVGIIDMYHHDWLLIILIKFYLVQFVQNIISKCESISELHSVFPFLLQKLSTHPRGRLSTAMGQAAICPGKT